MHIKEFIITTGKIIGVNIFFGLPIFIFNDKKTNNKLTRHVQLIK